MVNHICQTCNKEFNRKSNYDYHINNKKKPCKVKHINTPPTNTSNPPILIEIVQNTPTLIETLQVPPKYKENSTKLVDNKKKELKCKHCLKIFSRTDSLERHLNGRCKIIKLQKQENKNIIEKKDIIEQQNNNQVNIEDNTKMILTILMNQNKKLIEEIKIIKEENKETKEEINKIKRKIKFDKEKQNNDSKIVNDKLINIIINKDKKIEELKNDKPKNIISNLVNKFEDDYESESDIENSINLTINNHIIMFRTTDKYINATQLCKAGNKKFNDWFRLDNTKELISILESNTGILALNLVEKKIGGNHEGTFIHPDLAIQLAQWINPHFALQVSSWIRTLFTKGKVNIKLLKEQENKINKSTKKIKILEDMVLKKQKRTEYPDSNVIYLLTTEDHKKRRTYIIGKAKNLKERLSTYNKTCEHEVIYYKSCKNEKHMDLCEEIILLMLEEYREVANRDRFILPISEDIIFFTNIINKHC
jgi:hypothetical protein